MTKAVFKQHDRVFRVHVDGHAAFNPGNDIVCAAASALAQTLLCCAAAEYEAGHLTMFKYQMDDENAELHLRMSAKPEWSSRVSTMVGTIASGFALLANKFPDHVTAEFITPD